MMMMMMMMTMGKMIGSTMDLFGRNPELLQGAEKITIMGDFQSCGLHFWT
jgi:hypothetical protein